VVSNILFLLGIGFLAANLRLMLQFIRFLRLRSSALLTWPGHKPPYYGVMLGFGVILGLLVFYKVVVQQRPAMDAFGTAMMFLYYGYAMPLSLRIGRGFYADGIWSESGYMPYRDIGGLRWIEGEKPTLVLIARARQIARRLVVPETQYGAVRRLLRDKMSAQEIQLTGKGLDLGMQDDRDIV
jgi:hypothetical protein